jgi:hypothetical protein
VRITRLVLSFGLSVLFLIPSVAQQPVAQQPSAADTQATVLLQRAFAALTGSQSLSDVTLSGTARRIAGSDDETGTAVFKAVVSCAARTDLSFSSGPRSEVRDLSAVIPAGAWSGPDGISHTIPFHNLLSEPTWFFPAFAIARRLSASGYVATYVGQETRNSQTVEHISVSQTSLFQAAPDGISFERLTQVDLFLDSTTMLPASMSFNIHPDNNLLIDIPIEVRFSEYRLVSGAQVPFHVQKLLNNGLILDLRFQTATLNTGLSAADFQVR